MHFVGQIKLNCNDYEFLIVVSNYLQEADAMNSHIIKHIVSEEIKDTLRSVEFFIVIAVYICMVGLMFFAVV